MMKKTLLFFPALLFCLIGNILAQDLHIHYDVESSMIKYIYNGEEIKRPKIKKDGNIFLHVENYNNYLYSLEVKVNNQLLQIPSGGGLGSLLPGGFDAGGSGLLGFGNNDSGAGDGYINLESGGFGFGESEAFEQFEALNTQYESILGNMVKSEKVFSKIQSDVSKIEKDREFRSIGFSEIQKIKWNPNLSPEQVKRMSFEFLNKILEIEDNEELSLDYVIEKGDDRQELLLNLKRLEKNKKDYAKSIEQLNLFSESISNLNMDFKEFSTMKLNAAEVHENALQVHESLDSKKEIINQMCSTSGTKELHKMTSIWYEYEALKSNDFSYTFRTEATGDRAILGIKFTAKDSLGNILPANKKELAPIKVPVYGGMKLNVSIGISFAQYFNQPQSYFLRDTIIKAENTDEFLPIITSFFHFYPQSAGNVSVGGNFGIGIPLTNSENGQSLSFFLGPSFIFGKSQRIVLSTGVMGGKVQQLSQGLKVGDQLPPFSPLPTKTAYALGYFLGVSFNISGN